MESCCLHYLSLSVCYFIIFLADLSTGFGSLVGICGILVLVPRSKSRGNGENPVDNLCRSPVLTKELKKKRLFQLFLIFIWALRILLLVY